jgi:hypothetical protein
MASAKDADVIIEDLKQLVTKLADIERTRLVQERKFLESIKKSSYGSSTPTKDQQTVKAIEDVKKFLGVV